MKTRVSSFSNRYFLSPLFWIWRCFSRLYNIYVIIVYIVVECSVILFSLYNMAKDVIFTRKKPTKEGVRLFSFNFHKIDILDKVFKSGLSKFCGRQPLKNFKRYGLLLLNTLSHMCRIRTQSLWYWVWNPISTVTTSWLLALLMKTAFVQILEKPIALSLYLYLNLIKQ